MAKITVHNAAMTIDRLKAKYDDVMPIVGRKIMDDCNVFVRMRTGALKNSARVEDGGKSIRWRTRYAKRVYYTGTPSKAANPNASLRWCEKAKRAYSQSWAADITERVNG